jgi:hypothetical protein
VEKVVESTLVLHWWWCVYVSGRCGFDGKCTILTLSFDSSDMLVSALLIAAKPFFSVVNGESITSSVNVLHTTSDDRISGFTVRSSSFRVCISCIERTGDDSPDLFSRGSERPNVFCKKYRPSYHTANPRTPQFLHLSLFPNLPSRFLSQPPTLNCKSPIWHGSGSATLTFPYLRLPETQRRSIAGYSISFIFPCGIFQ